MDLIAKTWQEGYRTRDRVPKSQRMTFFDRPQTWGQNEIMRIVQEEFGSRRSRDLDSYLKRYHPSYTGGSIVDDVIALVVGTGARPISSSEESKWRKELNFVSRYRVHWQYSALLIRCAGGYDAILQCGSRGIELPEPFLGLLPRRVRKVRSAA